MTENDLDKRKDPADRRLGDEWLDWNGSTDPNDSEIDEKLTTFLTLAAGAVLRFRVLAARVVSRQAQVRTA